MRNLIFLIIVFCFSICGCNQASVESVPSNTVQSSQIYQIYYVDANKSQTSITATFRVGGATGTTLELNDPGKILCNGTPMQVSLPSNLIGTNYRMKGTDYRISSTDYRAKNEFSFTDNDGKNFTNSITLAPFEINGKTSISLDEKQLLTISLSRAVNSDEVLTIAVDSIIDETIPASDNSIYLNPSRNAIIIAPQFWKTKNAKPQSEVKLKIKKNSAITQGTSLGGSISAVYSAAPFYVSAAKAKNNVANAKNAVVKKSPIATNSAISETKNKNVNLKSEDK